MQLATPNAYASWAKARLTLHTPSRSFTLALKMDASQGIGAAAALIYRFKYVKFAST
ncbi:hypothetical protein D9M70_647630 [compost metagenome]